MKFLALLLAPLALVACSKGGDAGTANGGTPAAPAAPVAAKAPPAGQHWTDVVAQTKEGYVMGNPDAPLKLVEYGSRLCPTCGALAREGYAPLTSKYVDSGKVSLEFREFLVHGAIDMPPTLLGNCTGKDAFFPLLEQMYANQQSFLDKMQSASPAVQQQIQSAKPVDAFRMMAQQMGLIVFVKQRGIPETKAMQCLADQGQIDRWTKQTSDKSADGTVQGTPTLILNGQKLDAITWGQLEPLLKAAGA